MAQRLGILGGTFDPPHVGHLLVALDALDALALDRLLLIPAARQPLKQGVEMTEGAHRVAMTALMATRDPRLVVDDREVARGGLSFTVDTLRALRDAQPAAELFLILGEDSAATLSQWREPQAIAGLARIAVAGRGEAALPLPPPFVGVRLPVRRVDVSATEIRARVRAGQNIRGFVLDEVASYIDQHGLYRTTSQ